MIESRFALNKVTFRYKDVDALNGVSLEVPSGSFVGVAGPNGAGKSTLCGVLAGRLDTTSGEIAWNGELLRAITRRERARQLAVVGQRNAFDFPWTLHQFVSMGRIPYQGVMGFESKSDSGIVRQAMSDCDILELASRSVNQVSGGELQRAVVARALAQETDAILLDEPTQSLDPAHAIAIFQILNRAQKERGVTIVAASHDLNLLSRFADRIVLMNQGAVAAQGAPADVLREDVLSDVFGVGVETGTTEQGYPYVLPRVPGS